MDVRVRTPFLVDGEEVEGKQERPSLLHTVYIVVHFNGIPCNEY